MKRLTLALLVIWLLLSGLYAGSQPSLGGDLWWTLAAGRFITETGAVPDVDVFTYTAKGLPWHNQEWLAQVVYWTLFDRLGPDGLVLAKMALGLVFAGLLAWLCVRRSNSLVLGISTAAVVLLAWGHQIDLRAQFFTFLCTVALLLLLDGVRKGSRAAAIAIPLLLLVWVDLHYGFIFGLALIFGTWIVETGKSVLQLPAQPMPLRRSHTLGWIFAASVFACVLNPQGIDALSFPFEILDTSSPWKRIIEWRPPRVFRQGTLHPLLILIAVQIVVAAMAGWRNARRFDLTDFGMAIATAIMAFQSRRFIPLFAVVGAPFFATNLASLWCDAKQRVPALDRTERTQGTLAVGILAGLASLIVGYALWTQGNLATGRLFDRMTHRDRFPVEATEFLSTNQISGKIYNYYPWGGYLTFHLREPIHIDGRAHAVFPDELYFERRQIENLEPGWARRLARRDPQLAVHASNEPLAIKLRGDPNWVRIYDDGRASVLVHRTPANQDVLDAFAAGNLWYPDSPGAGLFLAELASRAGDRDAAVASMVQILTRWPQAGESALVRKLLVEETAGEIIPDPKAEGSAEALASALGTWLEPGEGDNR